MRKSSLILFLLFVICLSACGQTSAEPLSTTAEPTPIELTKTPIPTSPIIRSTQSTRAIKQSPSPTSTTSGQHVTLMAVGDVMLGRTIADLIFNEGYQAPFAFTAETLSMADVTIGNLECPISNRGEAAQKNYAFRAPLDAAKSLSYAGFDILSLGNNHILDYGKDGLIDTITALKSENIYVVGVGLDASQAYAPKFLERNGLKLAFLSYVDVPTTDFDYLNWEATVERPGIAWAHADQVQEGVRSAKKEADLVIVLLHNGYEFWQKVSERQQEIAKLAIDSGASLVIGSHPHVLQRIEPYKDGLIAYSMGNFVFDNFLFPPNYSAILSVELSPEGVESYELIQVVVQLNGVPQIMPYTIEE
jgi:poly-gamma-glutamate synthesis protein (capsule biosynthesis protein)